MNAAFKWIVSVSIFAMGFAMASSAFAYGHGAVGARVANNTSAVSKAIPPDETVSLTTIMDEVGALTNQESQTLTEQQTAEIDAIGLQAQNTLNPASQMLQGADMMMTMATVGLAVSMATAGMSMSGVGQASKAGDEAGFNTGGEPVSIAEQEARLFTITWSEPPQSDFRREEPAPLK